MKQQVFLTTVFQFKVKKSTFTIVHQAFLTSFGNFFYYYFGVATAICLIFLKKKIGRKFRLDIFKYFSHVVSSKLLTVRSKFSKIQWYIEHFLYLQTVNSPSRYHQLFQLVPEFFRDQSLAEVNHKYFCSGITINMKTILNETDFVTNAE